MQDSPLLHMKNIIMPVNGVIRMSVGLRFVSIYVIIINNYYTLRTWDELEKAGYNSSKVTPATGWQI